jgi:hypothetical protein
MPRYIRQTWAEPNGHPPEDCTGSEVCPLCYGSGYDGAERCPECRGKGEIPCECERCEHGIHLEDDCSACAAEYRAQEIDR